MLSTKLRLGLTSLDSCSTHFKQISCTYKCRDCAKSDWCPKFSILITFFFFRSLMKIPKLFFKKIWPSSYGIIDKSGQRNQHQKLLCGFSNIFVIVLAILKIWRGQRGPLHKFWIYILSLNCSEDSLCNFLYDFWLTLPKAMWAFAITWRPSSIVCRPLTFHILIFSSETPQPNELKLGRKHL